MDRRGAARACVLTASLGTPNSAVSALTLAALEDSGWYVADYSVAEPLAWGRHRGCTFASADCVDGDPLTSEFCNVEGGHGCTADLLGGAQV